MSKVNVVLSVLVNYARLGASTKDHQGQRYGDALR